MANGSTASQMRNKPEYIDNFFNFEMDPLDFVENRDYFDRLKKRRNAGLLDAEADRARKSGARILGSVVYGSNAWVTCRSVRYSAVVASVIRGMKREWTLRHDGDPERAIYDAGIVTLDKSALRDPNFLRVMQLMPASRKGEKLVAITSSELLEGSDIPTEALRELITTVAEDPDTTLVTFSPKALRILPQAPSLTAIKEQIDTGFTLDGATQNLVDTLTTPAPAIDYRHEY